MMKPPCARRRMALSILLMTAVLFRSPSLAAEPETPTAEEPALERTEPSLEEPHEEPLIEPRGPAGTVAVMNVNQVFREYARFADKMSELKAELNLAQAEIMEQWKGFRQRARRMERLDRGSRDYTAMQAELVVEKARIEANVSVQKREFAERESVIYFASYQELTQVTEDYAQANGIGLVLRMSHDILDRRNPAKVLQHVNRGIVWYDESVDITTDITGALNEAAEDLPPVDSPRDVGPTEQADSTSHARLWTASWTDDSDDSDETSDDDPAPGEHVTALLNVHRVFQEDERFTEAIAAMKLDLELADSEKKQRLEEITERVKQLEVLAPGSDAHQAMRREIAEERARLEAGVNVRRQEFARREAEFYADTYEEMCRAIKQYAPANGLTLVLRVSSGSPKEQKPAAVLQYVNKAVLWFSESADITTDIIAALNQAPQSGPPMETPDTSDQAGRAGLQRSLELQRVALRAGAAR